MSRHTREGQHADDHGETRRREREGPRHRRLGGSRHACGAPRQPQHRALTHAEVEVCRNEHGYNEVAQTKGHPVFKFLWKFWGISAWILELIMVLSAVPREYSDVAVVLGTKQFSRYAADQFVAGYSNTTVFGAADLYAGLQIDLKIAHAC